ncbi:MAG: MerR family transcriptional regulator [Spirochaetaceae bacterium]|nr:MerR family transcriptional regulator [Spirochaetaceae bacterium]
MSELYKIADIARQYQITYRTLHYYEEIGLLGSCREKTSGSRTYIQEELFRLEQILILRQLGLSIKEIQKIFNSPENESTIPLFRRRINSLDKEITALGKQKTLLEKYLRLFEKENYSLNTQLQVLKQLSNVHSAKDDIIFDEDVILNGDQIVSNNEIMTNRDYFFEKIIEQPKQQIFPGFNETSLERYSHFQDSMNTWPVVIPSADLIPHAYVPYFPSYSGSFPYTIHIPDENYGFFKRKGFLIISSGETLHILEKLGPKIKSIIFEKKDFMYLVSATVLLFSYISITGEKKSYSFHFNSRMKHLFNPVIDQFRNPVGEKRSQRDNRNLEIEDENLKNNLKFRNNLASPYVKERTIKRILFQPQQCVSYFKLPFFKMKLFRRYISNHLLILCSDELVCVQENPMILMKKNVSYDQIFSFIPLKNIKKATIENNKKNLTIITFVLTNGELLTRYFAKDNNYLESFLLELKTNKII